MVTNHDDDDDEHDLDDYVPGRHCDVVTSHRGGKWIAVRDGTSTTKRRKRKS